MHTLHSTLDRPVRIEMIYIIHRSLSVRRIWREQRVIPWMHYVCRRSVSMKRTAEVAPKCLWRALVMYKKRCHVGKGAYVAKLWERRRVERRGGEEWSGGVEWPRWAWPCPNHLGNMHTLRIGVLYRLSRRLTVPPLVTFPDTYSGKLVALH